MPELPEVETVRRSLKTKIIHLRITEIHVYYDKVIDGDTDYFKKKVIGQRFVDIERFGKYLIFLLDDCAFLSHLRMEGKYRYIPTNSELYKHDHLIFELDNGYSLIYNDTRKFGRITLIDKDNYRNVLPLSKLGEEPFTITKETLYAYTHKSQKPIKSLLLDQSIISGIGNIYANEICFQMGIDPRTKGKYLSKRRVGELITFSQDVLNKAIEQGGTTIHSFSALGIDGLFQVELNVHTQKVCKICGTDIKKITVGGRGTYYCPVCQKRRY